MKLHIVIADWEHYEGSYKIIGIYKDIKKAKTRSKNFEKYNVGSYTNIYSKTIKL